MESSHFKVQHTLICQSFSWRSWTDYDDVSDDSGDDDDDDHVGDDDDAVMCLRLSPGKRRPCQIDCLPVWVLGCSESTALPR